MIAVEGVCGLERGGMQGVKELGALECPRDGVFVYFSVSVPFQPCHRSVPGSFSLWLHTLCFVTTSSTTTLSTRLKIM